MWFDARKALAEIVGGDTPPATIATTATNLGPAKPRVAGVASVAAPKTLNPVSHREADAVQLAALLFQSGPLTYGAAASALGWGATRAWQAEAHLRAAGRVTFDALGRTVLLGGI